MRTKIIFLFLAVVCYHADSQTNASIQIDAAENVHFIVTDPSGRKTGADPRPPVSDTLYGVTFFNEIPGAAYGYAGTGSLQSDAQEPPENPEFDLSTALPSGNSTYGLRMIGVRLGEFWLNAFIDRMIEYHPTSSPKLAFYGVLDVDSVLNFEFVISGDTSVAVKLRKIVTPNSLFQDVAAMSKLNWIMDQVTTNKYVSFFTTLKTLESQNNTCEMRSILATIIGNLVADSAHTITPDANKSLRDDVNQLLSQLPATSSSLMKTSNTK